MPTSAVSDRAAPDRAALARAVLHRAEQGLGVRRTAPRGAVPTAGAGSAPVHARVSESDEDHWPVPDSLAGLLPGGGLRHGTVVAARGSTGLLLALLAGPSRAGAWIAAVGHPSLGLLAARDAGIDLDRVALVPAPGPEAATIVAALLDGLDVVVVGPGTDLTDAERRRLATRARERSAVLVVAGDWPGAHVILDAAVGSWTGVDRGAGWLRRRTLLVERTGRAGAGRRLVARVELPLGVDPLAALEADCGVGPSSGSVIDAPATRAVTVARASAGARLRLVG